MVSVPLRGLWFLSIIVETRGLILVSRVSVPLRGLWFLSCRNDIYVNAKNSVSVPLRGLWFLSLSVP